MRTLRFMIYLMAGMLAVMLLFPGSVVHAAGERSEIKAAADNDAFLMAVGKMAKQYKKQAYGAQAASDPFFSCRLIVKGKKGNLSFEKYGAIDTIRSNSNIYLVQFETNHDAQAAYRILQKDSKVSYVEPDAYMGVNDFGVISHETVLNSSQKTKTFQSWGVQHIYADRFASFVQNKTKQSITVAVVDSGVSKHSLLGSRLLKGYDFVDSDQNASDVFGHGTHVAGIISDSTPGLQVNILPVRVLNEYGGGDDSVIGAGVIYAADRGAKVINLSLGGKHSQYLEECIEYAIKKGAVVCVSSGNGHGAIDNFCPAHMKNAIVVGAVDAYDRHADFSNCGPSLDVVAPGVAIRSSIPGGKYSTQDGTSMACPFVSAAAAMLRLAYPSKSVSEIVSMIRKNVRDLGTSGYDEIYGAGVLRLIIPEDKVVSIKPASVKLSESSVTIEEGTKITLSVNIRPAGATDKTVTWKSSNKSVVSVAGGMITARKPGTAVITVSTVNGKEAECLVTVKKAVVDMQYTSIPEVDLYDASDSDKMKKALKIKTGSNKLSGTRGYVKFTAPTDGTYKFTFTGVDERKNSGLLTCSAVALSNESGFLNYLLDEEVETQGGYYSILYFCSAKSRKFLKAWDNEKRMDYLENRSATINLKKGKTIYFQIDMSRDYEYGRPVKMNLTVNKKNTKNAKPASITVSKTKVTLKAGDSVELSATVSPIYAVNRTVTWKSSRTDVATVKNGIITGVNPGTVVITASTVNGIEASCKVKVEKAAESSYTKIPEPKDSWTDSQKAKNASDLTMGVNKISTNSSGYVRFKAPSAGIYEFTFTAVNRKPPKGGACSVWGTAVMMMKNQYGLLVLDDKKVATQGGYASYLYFCSSETKNDFLSERTYSGKTGWTIPGRYARVRLKKGQTLYVEIHAYCWENAPGRDMVTTPLNLKLNVKKK